MNKIIIALIVVAAIAAGWFLLTASGTYDYVAEVDSEISELENELASLDAQVEAGTLSEEDATAAKVRIVTRLNAINEASTQSEKATLTAAQRAQLSEGLERLKVILVTYQGTLEAVEATANDTNVTAELARRGGSSNGSKRLSTVVADVIADVEETVIDSVDEYEANAELDAQVDAAVEESETEAEMTDEETTDDEAMEDEEMDTSTTTDEGMEDESMVDVEVSADAGLETTTN